METVKLPAGVWVNLNIETGITTGVQLDVVNITPTDVKLASTLIAPTVSDPHLPLLFNCKAVSDQSSLGAWAMSVPGGAISVRKHVDEPSWRLASLDIFPVGSFEGFRALTVQSYTEANSKIGVEHEGSTKYTALGASVNNTFFVTGALPVALKGRVIGFTGDGVTAEIFTGATYTGGISAAYQNASDINPVVGLSQIIVGATLVDPGTLAFAPDHLIGNTSNQGKGSTGAIVGREKLLKPNTTYLFRITSLDAATQDIASLLTWYEGELDLPRLT